MSTVNSLFFLNAKHWEVNSMFQIDIGWLKTIFIRNLFLFFLIFQPGNATAEIIWAGDYESGCKRKLS